MPKICCRTRGCASTAYGTPTAPAIRCSRGCTRSRGACGWTTIASGTASRGAGRAGVPENWHALFDPASVLFWVLLIRGAVLYPKLTGAAAGGFAGLIGVSVLEVGAHFGPLSHSGMAFGGDPALRHRRPVTRS